MFDKQKSETTQDIDKVKFCTEQIDKICQQYGDINQNNIDAFNYYFGKDYMKDIAGRSQVYTSDLADTIEWIMPSLVRIFAGGDDVTSLTPRKKEHADQVANHNELINYQIKVKNKWFIIINDWFKDALLLKRGAVKRQWHTDVEEDEKEYEDLTEMEFQMNIADPNVVEVTDVEEKVVQPEQYAQDPMTGMTNIVSPAIKSYNCTIKYQYEDEYPLIEAVPAEEYGFPIDTRDIEDCTFFFHKVKYDQWAFIDRYGQEKFDKVKEFKGNQFDNVMDESVKQERMSDVGFFWDFNDDKWIVYETFFRHPDNGKPWMRIICGNTLLQDEKNKYNMAPFRLLTPIKLSHRIIGMSMFDLLKDLQRIRTSLMRQMLDQGYFNLNGRWIIDPTRISFEDFLNANRPGGVIRTLNGTPADESGIRQLQGEGLPEYSFALFELLAKEKDYHSGVSRSFTGVNPQVLNKTFRGQDQQISQAQQRVEMMARLFAEMGVAPLIRDLVDMNTKFMEKDVAIKVVNDWINVTPEDVVAKADVIINVGLGTTSKDTLVQQNQQLIALYMQLYPIFGPALNAKILHALKELVKGMGYRDTQNWVPGEEEMMMAMQQMQQQQMMEAQAGGKKQGMATQPGQQMNQQAVQPQQPMQPSLTIPDIEGQYFG